MSSDELTLDSSVVNQEEIQIERRTTIRVRQPRKWPSGMVLCEARNTQMIDPKAIQEALSVPARELWKSGMQEEYDSLMENEISKLVDSLSN
jgi:hypothetical protein